VLGIESLESQTAVTARVSSGLSRLVGVCAAEGGAVTDECVCCAGEVVLSGVSLSSGLLATECEVAVRDCFCPAVELISSCSFWGDRFCSKGRAIVGKWCVRV
jgi:hypothetical protein